MGDHLNDNDGPNLTVLNREIDNYSTNITVFQEIDRQWQSVQKFFVNDADLDAFRLKYEQVFNQLKESYDKEQKWVKKCKETNSELVMYAGKVKNAIQMAQEDDQQTELYNQEMIEKYIKIEKLKELEIESKSKIEQLKQGLVQLEIDEDKILEQVRNEGKIEIQELTLKKINLSDEIQIQMTKVAELHKQNQEIQSEYDEFLQINHKLTEEQTNIKQQILGVRQETQNQERRKKNCDEEMEDIKFKIDQDKMTIIRKNEILNENKALLESQKVKIAENISQKEILLSNQRERLSEKNLYEKERDTSFQYLEILRKNLMDQKEQFQKKLEQLEELKVQEIQASKAYDILTKKILVIKQEKDISSKSMNSLYNQINNYETSLTEKKKQLDQIIQEKSTKQKERQLNDKNLKAAEEQDLEAQGQMNQQHNKLKKLENQVRGYQLEAQRLTKLITLLEKEQEKYGIEASQAHAKYYQTIEEVKIKNNIISELQKKNQDVESKLKHQQNLYEAVRSDRNLYSKNLLESQEEIAELTKRYTRMTHQVDQFKEELKSKNTSLVRQDFEFNKLVEENSKTRNEKERVKKNIASTDEVIKNQDNHLKRLKFIINEAKTEKVRQQKEYEMVVNERDILGQQLIKRNHELSQLYEKLKLSQSNLAKGEQQYRSLVQELKDHQQTLVQLRKELASTQDQISCIGSLKQEAISLEKEILHEKTRIKALEDELLVKMNVHRWRKLEATDQDNFERILKIQTLQRRLIAKTEEVNDKDNLIKEKEKLFMELKSILARQPGAEIHQQLEQYQQNIKDKSSQMKKMVGELKQAQDQVHLLQFDIKRLKDELQGLKQDYFNKRVKEDKNQDDQNQYQLQNNQMPRWNVDSDANQNLILEGGLF